MEHSLKKLEDAAKDEKVNLMDPIIECIENYCTLGEISGVFEKIYGRYNVSAVF